MGGADAICACTRVAPRASARQTGRVTRVHARPQTPANRFPLSKASIWLATVSASWHGVAAWEGREGGDPLDAVVFTRPDIYWQRSIGPWCSYELLDTWHVPAGGLAPDMFWILPRRWAERVLTSWDLMAHCAPGQPCCRLVEETSGAAAGGRGRQSHIQTNHSLVAYSDEPQLVKYSVWVREYWSRHGGGLRINSSALQGHGLVGAHHGKAFRDCTIHVGCMPTEKGLRREAGYG